MFKKLLFILCVFLASCTAGGFDITAPLIRIPSKIPDDPIERVAWNAYDDDEVGLLPRTYHGCVFFYLKTNLNCPDCDRMDESFDDKMTIGILNEYFLSYKVTDDDPDWDKAVTRFGLKTAPAIAIVSLNPHGIVTYEEGHLGSGALNDILARALGTHCYYDNDN